MKFDPEIDKQQELDRESNLSDGDKYRLLQAMALIKLVKLGKKIPDGKVDPYAVLTRDELARARMEIDRGA